MGKISRYIGLGVAILLFSSFQLPAQKGVRSEIRSGNAAMQRKEYIEAVEWYSRAIDGGYRDYDIYLKRGRAYYKAGFYNSAIDDFSRALYFNGYGEEAHLLLGKAKLIKNDLDGIRHLKLGGTEGLAIVRELELDEEQMPARVSDYINGIYRSTGTGFFIDPQGYIVTNYHVVENSNGFDVFVNGKGEVECYDAVTIIADKVNDLAIIKIVDKAFNPALVGSIPYRISSGTCDVGTEVFTMGYPEVSQLGEELKVTDGIISSRTGYLGDVTLYQISAPIQPGSSGGPLFNSNGDVVGITNAGVEGLQNVGYAIKSPYLNTLVEASSEKITMPLIGSMSDLPTTEKIKAASGFVVIIKVY